MAWIKKPTPEPWFAPLMGLKLECPAMVMVRDSLILWGHLGLSKDESIAMTQTPESWRHNG